MTDPQIGRRHGQDRGDQRNSPVERGVIGASLSGIESPQAYELASDTTHTPVRGLAWSQSPRILVLAGLVISVALVIAVAVLQLVLAPAEAIILGIVAVVALGAGGLAARGVGELRNSPYWKASGCFLCAAAYLATASVALVNGVPLIFNQ